MTENPNASIFDNLSDTARAVTVSRKPLDNPYPLYRGDEVIFRLGDKSVLSGTIRDGTLHVLHAYTEPKHRGNGYAMAVHQRALNYAHENGLHFAERDSIVEDRAHVYRALARRGYPVHFNSATPMVHEPTLEVDTAGRGLEPTHPDDPIWLGSTGTAPRFRRVNMAL